MLSVYAPTYGHLRLVVATNRYGDRFYVASNDLTADLTTRLLVDCELLGGMQEDGGAVRRCRGEG